MACRFDAQRGPLRHSRFCPRSPTAYVGNSRASEIECLPDGRFVYASKRGLDSIAIFAIDQATGRIIGRMATERRQDSPLLRARPDGPAHVCRQRR